MAGEKISNLPASPGALLADLLPEVQAGTTEKVTLQQVLNLFNTNIQLASTAQVTGLNTLLSGFLPLSGGTMTGTLILNTSAPTLPLEAASKGYVDTVATGFTVVLASAAATTANLNATQAGAGVGATLTNAGAMAAFSVDGYSASLNDRILVKNQTLSQHNGIYTVTTLGSGVANWVLTRATDYDQPTEIKPGTLVAVNNGTVNAGTSWLETATVVTVDTDPILFTQFTFASSSFLKVVNNLSDVSSASSSRTNLGLGTVATKTASDNSKTNAAMVSGATTIGNIAVFADVNGTVEDGGSSPLSSLNNIASGRLTFSTGQAVPTSNVTGATTVYFTPYKGNKIALFDGVSVWNTITFSEISIAVPASTNQMYDIFVYNNVGTATLELAAWTNDTTRATALVLQDGVYVKSGATTRRYIGSFRTTGTLGQTEDSTAKRYLWNYYNRICKSMIVTEATNSWNYSVAAFREANGSTANQLDMVIGVSEDLVYARVDAQVINSTASSRGVTSGIGLDSTTVNSATETRADATFNGAYGKPIAQYFSQIAAGRHTLVWLERGAGADTQSWFGASDLNANPINVGINGYLYG